MNPLYRRRQAGRAAMVCEPTPDEVAYATELAARETTDWNTQWRLMTAPEQDQWHSRHGNDWPSECCGPEGTGPSDPGWTPVVESGWLELAASGRAGVSTRELLAIAEAEPGSLGVPDRYGAPGDSITQLQCIDRLIAFLAARRHAVIGGLCPPQDAGGYRAEQHLVEEIQVATRVGPGVAHRDIEAARLLVGPFTRSGHDLAAGLISENHLRVLVFETRNIVDDPTPHPDLTHPAAGAAAHPAVPGGSPRCRPDKLAAIQARVAAAAHRQTPSQFRSTVRTAICAVDAQGEADRHAAAKKTRDVTVGLEVDGMGVLVDRDDVASVTAIHVELTRQAKALQSERGGTAAARRGAGDARIGACRADVLKTLILGHHRQQPSIGNIASTVDTAQEPPSASLEPPVRPLEGHLVIDLPTLRGEADHPCLLDGSPIPAPVGRELASAVRAWRRMVTDPVTGHLLDYGRRVYLPPALVKFIHARDGQCTAPYCQRPSTRCQIDHRVPFPDGPSDSANCGALCDRHHPLKTDRYLSISNGRSDGSMTWNTQWGQQVSTESSTYLDNPGSFAPAALGADDTGPPGDTPPPDPEADLGPPPF